MEISTKYNKPLTALSTGFLFIFFILTCTVPNILQAQDETDKDLRILIGRVMENERKRPIPDVQIISKNNRVGTFSDLNGYFELLVTTKDSVQFSSLGFATTVIAVSDTMLTTDHLWVYNLPVDTIQMHEIIIRGFPSYEALKQRIANMKPQDRPWNVVDYMNDHPLLYLKPNNGITTMGPVQLLYNLLNSEAVLQRQLIRNRRRYNRYMIKTGRVKDTIPAIPDYMRDKIR